MRLEDFLKINAEKYPQKTAVICGDKSLTYSKLWKESLNLSLTFPQNKIVPFRASQSIEFLLTYFAIHLRGSVAAPLESNISEEKFGEIASKIEGCSFPEGSADILYTTGTTGISKGVIISEKTILSNGENLIEGHQFSEDLAFVVSGPMNHIGSLSKIFPVIIKGATLIITDGIKDANQFFATFEYPFNRFATFLVPASIRMLIQFSSERLRAIAHKVDFIETGAAAISHDDMVKLANLLPNSRLYNTYASTETGIISTYNFNDGESIAGCLGKPMSHSQIIITDSGTISCKGDTLMSGYLGDKELTDKVLIDNTIYTSDIGYWDDKGRLRLVGRADDVINVGGYKVAPTEVENAALEFPDIADCVCIAVPHPITGSAVKLIVVLKEQCVGEVKSYNRKKFIEISKFLSRKLEPYKIPLFFETAVEIKRTFNGKIDRKFYKQ